MQEAQFNGLTYTIREDEDNETFEDTFVLTVQVSAMPPHITREFKTMADLLNHLNENGLSNLVWDEIEEEEI